MAVDCLAASGLLSSRPPRGRRWCRGGVTGLVQAGGTLYYMLGCEAEARFLDLADCGERVYRMEALGPGPWRGGDEYNAATAVDEMVYFAGWAAEAVLTPQGVEERRLVHVHSYNASSGAVALLWRSESRGHVTSLIYNPARDSVVASIGGGHERPGVYEVTRAGEARQVSPVRVAPGAWAWGLLCYPHDDASGGKPGLTCLDPIDYRGVTTSSRGAEDSIDGHAHWGGPRAAAAYGERLLVAGRGCLASYPDPGSGGPPRIYRLLSGTGHEPVPRAAVAGGSVYVAYRPVGGSGASLVVELAPPTARIAAVMGYRVTSVSYAAGSLLVAWSSHGAESRGVTAIPSWRLHGGEAAPATLRLRLSTEPRGGVPLQGYRDPEAQIHVTKGNTLTIYAYDLSTEPGEAEATRYSVSSGLNTLSLRDYRGMIVSLRLSEPDPGAWARLILA